MPVRHRRLPALIAALGVLGCQPAHFVPTPATTGAPATTTANAVPPEAASEQPAVTAQMSGVAAVGDTPVANAKLTVTDAITGKPLDVVDSGSLTTDAQGRFSFAVANLAPGQLVSLSAEGNGLKVSGIVRGDGTALANGPAGYRIRAVEFKFNLDGLSTALAATYLPFFRLLQRMSTADARSAADGLVSSALRARDGLDAELKKNPTLTTSLTSVSSTKTVAETVQELLAKAGLLSTVTTDVASVAANNNGFASALSTNPVTGNTVIEITINADGKLQVGNQIIDVTGIDLDQLDLDQLEVDNGVDDDDNADCHSTDKLIAPVFNNSATFKPQVAVQSTTDALTIYVSQNEGEHDISRIVAKVPLKDVSFTPPSGKGSLGTVTVTAGPERRAAKFDLVGEGSATSWSGALETADGAISIGKATVKMESENWVLDISNGIPLVDGTRDTDDKPINFGYSFNFVTKSDVFTLKECTDAAIAVAGQGVELATYTAPLAGVPVPPPSGTVLGTYEVGHTPYSVAVDSKGNVWVGNVTSDNVMKLSSDGTLLGTFAVADSPQAMAVDGSDNVWVADGISDNVKKLSPDGTVLGTYAVGNGPRSVAVDGSGNVWVANYSSHTVTKLSSTGTVLGTYTVGNGPRSVAVDGSGNVWVANYASDTVTKLSSTGTVLGTYAVGRAPMWVAVDGSGNVWVANNGSHNVTKLSSTGTVLGTYTVGRNPRSVAVDGSGNVWVVHPGRTSSYNGNVTKVSSTGTVLGTYTVGSSPVAVAMDGSRNVWVANSGHGRVTKLKQ